LKTKLVSASNWSCSKGTLTASLTAVAADAASSPRI